MTKRNSLLPFSLVLLALHLFNGCLARQYVQGGGAQFQNECQLDRLDALEPSERIECEGGRIEWWDHNHRQLQCAGVAVVRRIIEPNSLYLPTFHNAPQITYIVQGRGVMGRVLPGCAETFMDSQGGSQRRGSEGRGRGGQQQAEWGEQGRQFRDMHQKVEHVRKGDVFAWPAGTAHWCFNSGEQPLVVVSLIDIANHHNQLDRNPRSFYLAGNNQQGSQHQGSQGWRGGGGGGGGGGSQQQQANIFNGFDPQILAEAFNIDVRTAQQLQNQQDNRGNIVRVQGGFDIIRPPTRREHGEEEEEEYERFRPRPGRDHNGLEETFCTMRFHENLDDPSRADVYKPDLGRISNLNGMTLPILRFLRLSATRGVIHGNAVVLPKWNVNANEVMYVTRGRARIQVVNDNGQSVFDEELRDGQLLTIPQGFAVVKRAQGDRFDWISFKTNDNAMINTLAGRTSVMRAMPLEVISNAYQISMEEARRIKFNTQETTLTRASSSRGSRERPEA